MLDQAAISVILVVHSAQQTEFALFVLAQAKSQMLSVNVYLVQFHLVLVALLTTSASLVLLIML